MKINSYVVVPNDNLRLEDNSNQKYYLYDNKELKLLNLGNVRLYNGDIITNVIMKNINRGFKKILEFIAKIYEDDDSGDTAPLMEALNHTEKFKRELMNKERDFLKKEHLDLIDKKIKIIEQELKEKIYFISLRQKQQEAMQNYMENNPEEEYNYNYDEEYQGRRTR